MDINLLMRVLTLLVSLLQVLIWPLIIVVLLLYLRLPLKKFIEDIIEVNLKAGPLETTARRQKAIEAATSLGAATAIAQKQNIEHSGNDLCGEENTQAIATLVSQILTPQTLKKLEGKFVLWVDDGPSNNTYQRNSLEALGLRFAIATSTEDALKQLQSRNFDLVISDMGRPPDARAGYTLLENMQKMNITTPFIIYAIGGNYPEHKAEAIKRGAFASTSGPAALFETVIQAIEKFKD